MDVRDYSINRKPVFAFKVLKNRTPEYMKDLVLSTNSVLGKQVIVTVACYL